jgi:hypothetical protein
MPNKKIKHLEMIELVIERMSKDSFQLKGWAITLVTAILALASQKSEPQYVGLVLLPIVGFWILDAFYVQQERLYRLLYKQVTLKSEDDIDFSMEARSVPVALSERKKLTFLSCLFSMSVVPVYLISVVAAVFVMVLAIST